MMMIKHIDSDFDVKFLMLSMHLKCVNKMFILLADGGGRREEEEEKAPMEVEFDSYSNNIISIEHRAHEI